MRGDDGRPVAVDGHRRRRSASARVVEPSPAIVDGPVLAESGADQQRRRAGLRDRRRRRRAAPTSGVRRRASRRRPPSPVVDAGLGQRDDVGILAHARAARSSAAPRRVAEGVPAEHRDARAVGLRPATVWPPMPRVGRGRTASATETREDAAPRSGEEQRRTRAAARISIASSSARSTTRGRDRRRSEPAERHELRDDPGAARSPNSCGQPRTSERSAAPSRDRTTAAMTRSAIVQHPAERRRAA